MTKQQQNLAIEYFLGNHENVERWKGLKQNEKNFDSKEISWDEFVSKAVDLGGGATLPGYTDSLDEISIAEQALTGPQRETYVHRLLSLGTPFHAMTATAEQRAKELLKVIGRWKD